MKGHKVDRQIHIRGASEHNLKGVDVDIPLGGITVLTGPSGSGKTSLAMSTLYAEGQRRYVETFSPYVRQFMDRMDRPAVEAVLNVPPAIALGQRNSVKNSRSTVGTMTGMNEYLKLIFSRLAVGRDAGGNVVRPATPQGVADELMAEHPGETALICFAVRPVGSFDEMRQALEAQGYLRVLAGGRVSRLSDAAEAYTLGLLRDPKLRHAVGDPVKGTAIAAKAITCKRLVRQRRRGIQKQDFLQLVATLEYIVADGNGAVFNDHFFNIVVIIIPRCFQKFTGTGNGQSVVIYTPEYPVTAHTPAIQLGIVAAFRLDNIFHILTHLIPGIDTNRYKAVSVAVAVHDGDGVSVVMQQDHGVTGSAD